MRSSLTRLLVVSVLILLAAATPALGHGDPASDYLLSQPTFVPRDAAVPGAYANQLLATVSEAQIRGFTIKVAIIRSKYDMGSISSLFKQPKEYSRFLGKELAQVYKGRLLVVMPNGLAVSLAGKTLGPSQAVLDRVRPPGTKGVAMASAATNAVVALAAKAGVAVPKPRLATNTQAAYCVTDLLGTSLTKRSNGLTIKWTTAKHTGDLRNALYSVTVKKANGSVIAQLGVKYLGGKQEFVFVQDSSHGQRMLAMRARRIGEVLTATFPRTYITALGKSFAWTSAVVVAGKSVASCPREAGATEKFPA